MNAIGPADAAGADVAGCLDGLADPAVRDLAWLLFSADLLRQQPGDESATESFASIAKPSADCADCADTRDIARWLAQLDRDPSPLWRTLDASSPTRLGRYAETLLRWFLEHGPAARLVAANVPLRNASGRTLGECDFLVESVDGRRLHWELAVKCYLHAGAESATLAEFVGPNLRDRFDLKYARLLDHQLRLTERDEFKALGYRGPWLAQMFVKGWLFYEAGGVVVDPPALAPDHARGWWVRRSDWCAFAAQQGADGWSVLPRLAWLAPRRINAVQRASAHAPNEHTPLAQRMSLAPPVDAATLIAALPRDDTPSMVAAFVADGANGYIERSRGFIVPDDWPERARAFSRA